MKTKEKVMLEWVKSMNKDLSSVIDKEDEYGLVRPVFYAGWDAAMKEAEDRYRISMTLSESFAETIVRLRENEA